jgi:hypothetical protein
MSSKHRKTIVILLAKLRVAAVGQSERLKPLLIHCEAVGLENVDSTTLVEIAAETELLRRINDRIAQGEVLLGGFPSGPPN